MCVLHVHGHFWCLIYFWPLAKTLKQYYVYMPIDKKIHLINLLTCIFKIQNYFQIISFTNKKEYYYQFIHQLLWVFFVTIITEFTDLSILWNKGSFQYDISKLYHNRNIWAKLVYRKEERKKFTYRSKFYQSYEFLYD